MNDRISRIKNQQKHRLIAAITVRLAINAKVHMKKKLLWKRNSKIRSLHMQ